MMLKKSFAVIFLLGLCAGVTLLPAQSKIRKLSGQVIEHIQRGDGQTLDIPLSNVHISVPSHSEQTALTNAEGYFELLLSTPIRSNERFDLKAEKAEYGLLSEKKQLQTVALLSLTNHSQFLPHKLVIYMTRQRRLTTENPGNVNRIPLSGYIASNDRHLEDVEVKVKGIETIHDITNEIGYFEMYLPTNDFNPDGSFTLILEKDGKIQEITFANMRSFQEQQFFEFANFASASKNRENQPKRYETPPPSFTETRFLPLPEKNEVRYIEKNFRRFIKNLDRIDFKDLSPAQIQSLKDSLNHYADYISEITKDYKNLRQSTDYTNYLKAAKELAEKEKKLLETEKELVKSELQNQNKTIVIASLSIILLILSGWVYYYVYVNRKIRSQAGELNKRNHFIEFLLRELNHRVTNNLQVISSMLRRKMRRLPDDNARLALQEINKRVIDISAIHVGLYSKNDAEVITLDHYLRNLTKTLEKLYTFEQKPVHIQIDSPALPIAHKNAVFFGLIINELVTNSLKYAFTDTDEPKINIVIQKPKPQLFAVQVCDNGKGLPPDFNLEEAKSSGLKLVNLITQMLDGTFKMSSEQGSKFELTLKLS